MKTVMIFSLLIYSGMTEMFSQSTPVEIFPNVVDEAS